jgi:hypothetical protein
MPTRLKVQAMIASPPDEGGVRRQRAEMRPQPSSTCSTNRHDLCAEHGLPDTISPKALAAYLKRRDEFRQYRVHIRWRFRDGR